MDENGIGKEIADAAILAAWREKYDSNKPSERTPLRGAAQDRR